MVLSNFSQTGSSSDRQFLPFPSDFCPNFRFNGNLILFNVSSWHQKGCQRWEKLVAIVCVSNYFTVAKIVCCFNIVGMIAAFKLDLPKLWTTFLSDKSQVCAQLSIGQIYPTEMYWKLTPIVWSNPLVIPHLKTIENRRYVHLRYENIKGKKGINWFTSPTVELPPCPRSLLKNEIHLVQTLFFGCFPGWASLNLLYVYINFRYGIILYTNGETQN